MNCIFLSEGAASIPWVSATWERSNSYSALIQLRSAPGGAIAVSSLRKCSWEICIAWKIKQLYKQRCTDYAIAFTNTLPFAHPLVLQIHVAFLCIRYHKLRFNESVTPPATGQRRVSVSIVSINNGAGAQLTADTEYNASHLQANLHITCQHERWSVGHGLLFVWQQFEKAGSSLHLWCNSMVTFLRLSKERGSSGRVVMSSSYNPRILLRTAIVKCIFSALRFTAPVVMERWDVQAANNHQKKKKIIDFDVIFHRKSN